MLYLRAMLPCARPLPSITPCARLAAGGPESLSDGELTAAVMLAASAEGQRVLDRLGGLRAVARAGMSELCSHANLSVARACRLKAAFELGRRAVDEPLDRGELMSTPELVQKHLRATLIDREQEELHVLGLDAGMCLATHFVAAVGSANLVQVAPRDVYGRLLREGAFSLILVHNHPSGDAAPSESDDALTDRFLALGRELCLPLVDHVILAHDGFYSFARDWTRNAWWG